MKEKAGPYLGMALLPFVILALELLVLVIESLFYGTMDFSIITEQRGLSAPLLHWGFTCLLWAAGVLLLYRISNHMGFDVFANTGKVPVANWIVVAILFMLSVVASYLAWDMRFKPIAEYSGMIRQFGAQGIFAFFGQYLYYLVESALFLAIVVFGQKFGELAFNKNHIPWGGLLCGLTWGLGHIITQDLSTGIYTAISSVLYGVVYLLLKKNVRLTYPALALMFML